MLDIGVGCGRTTLHFAPLVERYLGIDYSEEMISICQHEYSSLNQNINFKTLDLRELSIFNQNEFDLILISFNGIDYINAEDRLEAFKEIKRIIAPSGAFCFSTHNIRSLNKLYKFEFRKNVIEILKNIYKKFKLYKYNKNLDSLLFKKSAIINDGALNFGLNTFYIQPEEQIKQLLEIGFNNIRIFDLKSGAEILDKQLLENKDFYLYYLCTVNK
jgi:ubiquinone/menaquinone biosynthesis C-methylase UbiE